MTDFAVTAARLPDTFWDHFPDQGTAAYAQLIERWAVARGLAFGAISPDGELPTWYVIDTDASGELYPILTLQAEYTAPDASGSRALKGVPDIPFRRFTGPHLSDGSAQFQIVKALHDALPQDKAEPTSVPKWWPFTWRQLAGCAHPGRFLAVLDTMINDHRAALGASAA